MISQRLFYNKRPSDDVPDINQIKELFYEQKIKAFWKRLAPEDFKYVFNYVIFFSYKGSEGVLAKDVPHINNYFRQFKSVPVYLSARDNSKR